uniref:L1 transposable element RRM domain-containing protein n=1 Tax=Sinocyclocheilus anshuiensis TaxID=1608454 RepID=A0A671PGK8_9TELE
MLVIRHTKFGLNTPNLRSRSLKTEILTSLRKDLAEIFRSELRSVLGDDLATIKSELHAVKAEFSNSMVSMQMDMSTLKSTVKDMEHSLSTCSDDITVLQEKVESLSAAVVKLEDKCEDLEVRSRRNNIRIIGVPEENPSTTVAISKLLKEALNIDKDIIIDRSHRPLQPRPRPGERPRTTINKNLKRAREKRQLRVGDMTISIFPDFTAKTARGRSAFSDVRQQLRSIPGVKFGFPFDTSLQFRSGSPAAIRRLQRASKRAAALLQMPRRYC